MKASGMGEKFEIQNPKAEDLTLFDVGGFWIRTSDFGLFLIGPIQAAKTLLI
jgi:hypothetical protein